MLGYKVNSVVGFLLLFVCLISVKKTFASHAMGADLSYSDLGNNQYEVTLNFYRDCSGQAAPGTGIFSPPLVDIVGCGVNSSATLNLQSFTEVPLKCPSQQNQTTCNGGNLPGVERYVYTGIITVPTNCSGINVSYRTCCRNNSITNLEIPNSRYMYIEVLIKNDSTIINNSSPVFVTLPLTQSCVGFNLNYSHGAIDIDGDSLGFSLVNPLDDKNIPIPFENGYSVSQPIASSSFNFDSTTGLIQFTPSVLQTSVLSVKVEEFRNGVLIGSTMRDMQLSVEGCPVGFNYPIEVSVNNGDTIFVSSCQDTISYYEAYAHDPGGDSLRYTYIDLNSTVSDSLQFAHGSTSDSLLGYFSFNPVGVSPGIYDYLIRVENIGCYSRKVTTQNVIVKVLSDTFSTEINDLNLQCYGDNGSAEVEITGGLAPYTIEWNTNPVQDSSAAVNLSAGVYPVKVTDAVMCEVYDTLYVTEPDSLSFVFNNSSASCGVYGDGSIDLTVSGGSVVDDYTYEWSTLGDSSYLDSLFQGEYFVTVTDDSGCSKVGSTVVSGVDSLVKSFSNLDVLCYRDSSGIIDLSVSGGNGDYSYLWSNPSFGDTNYIAGLPVGNYQVTIVDDSGCTSVFSTFINEPDSLYGELIKTSYNGSDVSCFGANDAELSLFVSGGVQPYSYSWSANVGSQTLNTVDSLASGTYSVTAIDSNGCSIDFIATLENPNELNLNFNIEDVLCEDSLGKVVPVLSGGTGNYTFSWSNGLSDSILNGNIDEYILSVTDENMCEITDTVSISDSILEIDVLVVPDSGSFEGALFINASGGVPSYTFWLDSIQIQNPIDSLSAGTYFIEVFDANGCKVSKEISIPEELNTSVQEYVDFNSLKNSLLLYPNPSNGSFSLEFQKLTEQLSYIIYDFQGRAIESGAIEKGVAKKIFNYESLVSGLYFIKFKNVDGSCVKKLIVN